MKTVYSVGDDIFIAMAFVSFVIGIGLRILSISQTPFGITHKGVMFLSMMCLLFSIALSLREVKKEK